MPKRRLLSFIPQRSGRGVGPTASVRRHAAVVRIDGFAGCVDIASHADAPAVIIEDRPDALAVGDGRVRRAGQIDEGKEKGTSLNYAQQKRNLGGEEGTSEGNLVALACSRDSNVASRSVLQRRSVHLRPPHSARPRRAGRGAGDSSETRRLWRMVLDVYPGDPEAMSRGKASRVNRGASREAAPTRRAPPRSEASRRTPQFPLRTGNGPASPAVLP